MEQTLTAPPAHDSAVDAVPAVRRRGRPRDNSADERILQAAGRLILERGFDKVTVDDVASMARAGKATVYRRWSSKEDLALAALEQLYRQELTAPDTGNLREDLRQYFAAVLEFCSAPSGYAHIRMSMAEALRDPRIAALHQTATRSQERVMDEILQRGIARGEVRPGVNLKFASTWLGGLITQCAALGQEMPSPDDVDAILDFMFHGISV